MLYRLLMFLVVLHGAACQYLPPDLVVNAVTSGSNVTGCFDITFTMPSGCVRTQPNVGVGPLSAVKLYPFTNSYNPSDLCPNNNNRTGCCTVAGAYMAILTETVTCSGSDYLLVATAAIPVPMVTTQSIASFVYVGGNTTSYVFHTCYGTTSSANATTAALQDPTFLIIKGTMRKLYPKNGHAFSVAGVGCKTCPVGSTLAYSTVASNETQVINSTCSEPILWDPWYVSRNTRRDCYPMTSPTQVVIYAVCNNNVPKSIVRGRFYSCIEESSYLLRVAASVTTIYLRNGTSTIDVLSCQQSF